MSKERNREPFVSFGADVKAARQAKGLTQKQIASMLNIDHRYFINIENKGALPSLPVFYAIVRLCNIPTEKYFNPEQMHPTRSLRRDRLIIKLMSRSEKELSVLEAANDAFDSSNAEEDE